MLSTKAWNDLLHVNSWVNEHVQPLTDAQFLAFDSRACKRDRKTHACVQQQVIVRKVAKIPAKNIGIDAQLTSETLGNPQFIEVAERRLHRQTQYLRAHRIELRRTGQKKIFNRGRLESSIIGSVNQEVETGKKTRDGQPRTPCRFVHD